MTFGVHKLVCSQQFFGLPIQTLTIIVSTIERLAEKNVYLGAHTFSVLKYCGEILLKSIYTK